MPRAVPGSDVLNLPGPAGLAGLALALASVPALADDSSAALGAGGVVLTRSADIRMVDERLAISPRTGKIRFEFVNESDQPIDTLVAFPMPDLDASEFSEVPLGTTTEDSVNFMGFKVWVDGVEVLTLVEQRAFVGDRDVTDVLRAAGLPVNPISEAGFKQLDSMSADQRKMLDDAGVADVEDPTYIHPLWTVRTRFYWNQHFPAHKPVVLEQSYQPVTGQSFFGRYALDPANEDAAYYRRDFCLDAGTKAGLTKMIAESEASDPINGGYLAAYTTEYVLKSGANWKGPIGHFHLVLDKLAPGNVLSLCWNGHLTKTGPTTLEADASNFTPTEDIRILVIEPLPR